MSRDPVLGNRADEQAQAGQGKDFVGINESGLPRSGPELDVDVKSDGVETIIQSRNPEMNVGMNGYGRALALQHTPTDLLDAQLTEEESPAEYTVPAIGKVYGFHSRLARAIGRNRNREELIWYGVRDKMQMAAIDLPPNSSGRILVKQDTLASEYSCRECDGKGYTDELCRECRGSQKRDDGDCTGCVVLGYSRERKYASGHEVCGSCRGTGWRTGVIIPEVAEAKPVTGIVVSLGPNTHYLKLGDRVLHSKYAGHGLTTPAGETFTMMRESEVMALIREL